MSRRGCICLCALLVLSCVHAFADVTVLSVEFVPQRYHVGQEVRVVLAWDDRGISWSPTDGAFSPTAADGQEPSIRSFRLLRRSGSAVLELTVIPWLAGTSVLPAFELAGLRFPPVELNAESVLGGRQGYRPQPWGQLEPGGMRLRIYMLVAAALALGLGIFALLRFILPKKGMWQAARAIRVARKNLEKTIAALSKTASVQDERAWARLCSALRSYAQAVLALPVSAMTPAELVRASGGFENSSCQAMLLQGSADVLSQGDRARFALDTSVQLQAALTACTALLAIPQPALDTGIGKGNMRAHTREHAHAHAREHASVKGSGHGL